MTSTLGGGVDTLKRRRPEWSPWLAVVEEVLRETTSDRWDAAIPPARESGGDATAPLLSGATIAVDGAMVRRLMDRMIGAASRNGASRVAALKPALQEDIDPAMLFSASISQNYGAIADFAGRSDADAEALQALVSLLGLPFLHACHRRWSSLIAFSWSEGYCGVCGAWPAFAELRGIERSRHLRCGRCGSAWHAPMLLCTFCGTNNHEELTTLVPDKAGSSGAIDACKHCHGYVKVFTRLQGCPPAAVMLEDLGSVDFDVAALAEGYTRPPGAARALDVTVNVTSASRRFFAWNG